MAVAAGGGSMGLTGTPAMTRRTGLNRVPLLGPPGGGRLAGRVLGAVALGEQVRHAGLADARGADPVRSLDQALRAGDPRAGAVAAAWVAALTQLLGVLTAPTQQDRSARAEWSAPDWDRWAAIERIVLCGGVVAGELGRRAMHAVGRPSGESGHATPPRPAVVLAPEPARASLSGLAAAGPGHCLVLDLGHGSIKGVVATTGTLGEVVSRPVPWTAFDTATWPPPEMVCELVGSVARDAVGAGGTDPSPDPSAELEVTVSIANYVVDGRLDDDQTYGRLAALDEDPARLLGRTVGAHLGRPARVTTLVNDGRAAALGWSDGPPTAVISVGTSLGLGFADARG